MRQLAPPSREFDAAIVHARVPLVSRSAFVALSTFILNILTVAVFRWVCRELDTASVVGRGWGRLKMKERFLVVESIDGNGASTGRKR